MTIRSAGRNRRNSVPADLTCKGSVLSWIYTGPKFRETTHLWYIWYHIEACVVGSKDSEAKTKEPDPCLVALRRFGSSVCEPSIHSHVTSYACPLPKGLGFRVQGLGLGLRDPNVRGRQGLGRCQPLPGGSSGQRVQALQRVPRELHLKHCWLLAREPSMPTLPTLEVNPTKPFQACLGQTQNPRLPCKSQASKRVCRIA